MKFFENDSESTSFGPNSGLTAENGTDEVIVYGDITISKDTPVEKINEIITFFESLKEKLS